MSCGHTQVSPSSSKIQLPFSQLQHSFFTRVFTLRLCRGDSRLIPVILHQQDKRQAPCTRLRSARLLWKGCALQAPVIPRPCKAAQAYAALQGRDYVVPEDVKGLAPAVLCHRVVLGGSMNAEAATQRLRKLLSDVEVPLENH